MFIFDSLRRPFQKLPMIDPSSILYLLVLNGFSCWNTLPIKFWDSKADKMPDTTGDLSDLQVPGCSERLRDLEVGGATSLAGRS